MAGSSAAGPKPGRNSFSVKLAGAETNARGIQRHAPRAVITDVRYIFDTSAINRLLNDPDHEALVRTLVATAELRISAFNVIEAAKTRDSTARIRLLQLLQRLSPSFRFLDRPNTIVRAVACAFANRDQSGRVTVTVNRDPDLDGLGVALNNPDDINEELRQELLDYAAQWECDFDKIVAGDRDIVQRKLNGVPSRARRPAETLRAYIRNRDQVYAQVIAPIFERETGRQLRADEYSDLGLEPVWWLYLGAYAYGMHCRSVHLHGYSRRKVAGAFDLGQAIYLRFCDRFVTDDTAQYRALRLLNRFSTEARPDVLTYDHFRARLIPPSLTRYGTYATRESQGTTKILP
jgi:predicted nucleic acid-binding protein